MVKVKYILKKLTKSFSKIVSKIKFFLFHRFYKNLKKVDYKSSEEYLAHIYTPKISTTNHNEPFKYDCSLTLSIIVPIYNVKNYLSKCVESLIQKTPYSYEIILVDDGSTDGSSAICDEFAKKNSFIKVIHQKNAGVSRARNNGIINSSGKYVFFVDSDDYLLPNTLSNVDLDNLDYDIIQFRHSFTSEKKVFSHSHKFSKRNPKVLNLYYGFMWNKFYKREIFTNIKNVEGCWFEDMINDLIIFPTYKNIKTSNEITYHYVNNDKGITSTSRQSLKILDSFFVMKEIINHVDNYKINYSSEHLKRLLYQASSQIYARIRKQDKEIIKHCFILLCQLVNSTIEKYSINIDDFGKYEKLLISAFKTHNFSSWKNISQFYK